MARLGVKSLISSEDYVAEASEGNVIIADEKLCFADDVLYRGYVMMYHLSEFYGDFDGWKIFNGDKEIGFADFAEEAFLIIDRIEGGSNQPIGIGVSGEIVL